MSEEERTKILKAMESYTKKLKDDKKASKAFLDKLGMLTKGGKLKRKYRRVI